jgi:hypothetical protein
LNGTIKQVSVLMAEKAGKNHRSCFVNQGHTFPSAGTRQWLQKKKWNKKAAFRSVLHAKSYNE